MLLAQGMAQESTNPGVALALGTWHLTLGTVFSKAFSGGGFILLARGHVVTVGTVLSKREPPAALAIAKIGHVATVRHVGTIFSMGHQKLFCRSLWLH